MTFGWLVYRSKTGCGHLGMNLVGMNLASLEEPVCRFRNERRTVSIGTLLQRRFMTLLTIRISRRAIVQTLLALPALSLFRRLPDADPPYADPNEIVEVNGWILKRSDLA
jgi:hypothetical protein